MTRRDRREHDRTLELVASAIDYSLTAAQSAALDAHLVTCPACDRSAAAMRGDANALRPRTTPLPSRRVDDAISAAIAGRRVTSPSLLVLVTAVLLLIALLGVAAAAGNLLLRSWWIPPSVDFRFDAVFVRPPADGDATASSMIVAVGADGTERLIASVPGVATDVTASARWMALSESGHLALPMRTGDRVVWAILDVANPSAKPIPVALPGRDDGGRGFAVWGPGGRLAIVLSPQSDRQAVAFVDPTTGAATVRPMSILQYTCFSDRCGIWAADGSGVVMYGMGPPSGRVILGPDGRVAPFGARAWPNDIGDRDVNAAGELLFGGIDPMDQLTTGSTGLSVRAPGGEERPLLWIGGVEIADRAWAADGRGAWILTAEWQAASRPVTLERFTPPSTRTAIASFVAAVDVPAKDFYAQAASFAGIAPDDSLAVVEVATTSSDPVVFQGKLVDMRSGSSTDVDGSFVGWLPSEK
jgi:hypothetical protein